MSYSLVSLNEKLGTSYLLPLIHSQQKTSFLGSTIKIKQRISFSYRPMIVGSSAIAISSVGALFPLRLRE
jgi:hypothetical protein